MIFKFIRILFLPIKLLNRIIYGSSHPNIAAYAWYTQQEYKKIVEDSEDDLNYLIANYAKWEDQAHKKIAELKQMGCIVIKVHVEKDKLEAWLRKERLKNTSENREKYVMHRLHDFH